MADSRQCPRFFGSTKTGVDAAGPKQAHIRSNSPRFAEGKSNRRPEVSTTLKMMLWQLPPTQTAARFASIS